MSIDSSTVRRSGTSDRVYHVPIYDTNTPTPSTSSTRVDPVNHEEVNLRSSRGREANDGGNAGGLGADDDMR